MVEKKNSKRNNVVTEFEEHRMELPLCETIPIIKKSKTLVQDICKKDFTHLLKLKLILFIALFSALIIIITVL